VIVTLRPRGVAAPPPRRAKPPRPAPSEAPQS